MRLLSSLGGLDARCSLFFGWATKNTEGTKKIQLQIQKEKGLGVS